MKKKLSDNIQYLKGVGPRRAEKLARLGLYTVEDLLYYFPRKYEDRREVKKITSLQQEEAVVIKAQVQQTVEQKPRRGLYILRVKFADTSGTVTATWFNQPYLKKIFERDCWFFLYGSLNEKSLKFNKKEMSNPVFEKVTDNKQIHTCRIVPFYSLTSGISQQQLRKIMFYVLRDYQGQIDELLPEYILEKYNLADLSNALQGLHFPESRKHFINARKRMSFEELFILQLLVLQRKEGIISQPGIKHDAPGLIIAEFLDSLPFSLTSAQERTWQEIKKDMEKEIPMQRLLQGDVGSGKTVIAILALLETMANGYQGLLMAPTEILAEQHYLNIENYLEKFDFSTALLTGSLKNSSRKELQEEISRQKIDLIIGTHALFQEGIDYQNIGLVVIDEQHRFGVEQRYTLKEKGENPDLLVMTATPIPRSLALTFYGDLDLSIIDELPPGRKDVKTVWRKPAARNNIYSFVREKIKEGRQAFVVCPLIEPSDEISALSAEETKDELTDRLLAGFNVGILHSKLSADEKKDIMEKFRKNQIHVLVSTTVVEVGVDIPNASLMVIENAERFGLAQLHQLRGRVGRGEYQSYCILIASPGTPEARKRIQVITASGDGFRIAEEDLKIRGPGEFFGKEQHGMPDLKIADILKDQKVLNIARQEASLLLKKGQLKKDSLLYQKLKELELKV